MCFLFYFTIISFKSHAVSLDAAMSFTSVLLLEIGWADHSKNSSLTKMIVLFFWFFFFLLSLMEDY